MEFLDNFQLTRPANVNPFSSFDVKHVQRWTDILLATRSFHEFLHRALLSRDSYYIDKFLTVQG